MEGLGDLIVWIVKQIVKNPIPRFEVPGRSSLTGSSPWSAYKIRGPSMTGFGLLL